MPGGEPGKSLRMEQCLQRNQRAKARRGARQVLFRGKVVDVARLTTEGSRPRAMPRKARSAALFDRQMRPSSRKRVKAGRPALDHRMSGTAIDGKLQMKRLSRSAAVKVGFASDTPLEEAGFEPPVPLLRKLCRGPMRDADTISEAT
jgi:hypothetical protein